VELVGLSVELPSFALPARKPHASDFLIRGFLGRESGATPSTCRLGEGPTTALYTPSKQTCTPDSVNGFAYLRDVYTQADTADRGRGRGAQKSIACFGRHLAADKVERELMSRSWDVYESLRALLSRVMAVSTAETVFFSLALHHRKA
jgi:hypothetical protein